MNDASSTPTRSTDLRRWVRPHEDRVVAGVASGVATALGLKVRWVRVAFVALGLVGGLGVLLYLVGWATIPQEGSSTSPAQAWLRGIDGGSRWFGVALIGLGAAIFFSATDIVRSDWLWAGILLLVGALLYRGDLALPPAGGRPEPPTPSQDRSDDALGQAALSATKSSGPAAEVEGSPARDTKPARPRRHRSLLGRLTLAALFVVVGVMALLDNADVARPLLRHYLGAVTLVLGVALLVAAWWGRARTAIVLGLLVAPLLVAATATRVDFAGRWGDYWYRPTTNAEVAERYDIAFGDLSLDLRESSLRGPLAIDAEVGAGRLLVIVPLDADLHIAAHVGIGTVDLFGSRRGGIDVERSIASAGTGPRIDLDVQAGFGELMILRAPS